MWSAKFGLSMLCPSLSEYQVQAMTTKVTELFDAVGTGQADHLQSLLVRGFDPNARDVLDRTPLVFACLLRPASVRIVQLLLEAGGDVNARDEHGVSSLLYASLAGDINLVRLLVSYGADVAAKDSQHYTALHYASRSGNVAVLKYLLDLGLEVDSQNAFGATPLVEIPSWANTSVSSTTQTEKRECMKLLIQHGADPNVQRSNGVTALMLAAAHSSLLLEYLLSTRVDLNIKDNCGKSALSYAISSISDRKHKVELLLPSLDVAQGATLIYQAISANDLEVVELLLQGGIAIDVRDSSGFTPLMHALCLHREEVAKYLLESGADPKARSFDDTYVGGQTVLGCALGVMDDLYFERGTPPAISLAFVKRLIDLGADPNVEDSAGQTPIFYLCNRPQQFSFLLENGANLNHRSKTGRTLLMAAAESSSMFTFRIILGKCSDINAVSSFGFNALFAAVRNLGAEAVTLLLKAGADVNARLASGCTPLMYAVDRESTEREAFETVKSLLAHGADLNAQGGEKNRTPLMFAVLNGNEGFVKLLLEKGASLEPRDSEGNSAIDLGNGTGLLL